MGLNVQKYVTFNFIVANFFSMFLIMCNTITYPVLQYQSLAPSLLQQMASNVSFSHSSSRYLRGLEYLDYLLHLTHVIHGILKTMSHFLFMASNHCGFKAGGQVSSPFFARVNVWIWGGVGVCVGLAGMCLYLLTVNKNKTKTQFSGLNYS